MRAASRALAAVAVLSIWPRVGAAEDGSGWRVDVRQDTVLRWAPRYVITADRTVLGANDAYWHRVDQLPLYERVGLDARWSHPSSRYGVDVHAAAWGALDLTFDAGAGLVAGDFALAYGSADLGPVALWAGRRFVPWGLPGGLHLDGGGVAVRTTFGLVAEAVAGRPVTPVVAGLLGGQASFDGPLTVAYGARLGYRQAGYLATSASYVERWVGDLAADRVVAVDATWSPLRLLDLAAGLALDVNEVVVQQASARAFVLAHDLVEVDVAYAHADPRALLPRYSILSVFATGVYHEGALGVTVRVRRAWALRAEGAGRLSLVPGHDGDDRGFWGYRAALAARYRPRLGGTQVTLRASRRADDDTALTLIHAAASFSISSIFRLGFEGAVAVGDDRDRGRDSFLGRASAEVPLGRGVALGATFDAARTPIAEAELRGLLHLRWQDGWRGGRP